MNHDGNTVYHNGKKVKLRSLSHIITKKNISQWINGDFPGGLAVKSLSASVGDTGSIPGPGNKITHAAEH